MKTEGGERVEDSVKQDPASDQRGDSAQRNGKKLELIMLPRNPAFPPFGNFSGY